MAHSYYIFEILEPQHDTHRSVELLRLYALGPERLGAGVWSVIRYSEA